MENSINTINIHSKVVETKVIKITPELASMWLSNNSTNNRNINQSAVRTYKEDMIAGNWVLNGEGIRFDTNGNIRDGYHRLNAIKQCEGLIDGVTMMVTVGINPNDAMIYDMGMKRTTSHYMKFKSPLDKYKYSSAVIALAKMYYSVVENNTKPSNAQVEDFINNNNTLIYNLYTHMNIGKSGVCQSSRKSILYACYRAIIAGESYEDIYQFMRVFNSGKMEDVIKDEIIINFRDSYMKEFASKGSSRHNEFELLKMTETYLYNYINPKRKKKFTLADCSYCYSMI